MKYLWLSQHYKSQNPAEFTGKERDAETGLDYFGARYMSAAQGRFTSPDAPFADQHVPDPQSWNLHSYVRNNPLRFIDPTGRTLTASQGWDQMQGDLCSILGVQDCSNRLSRDGKTGTVTVNFTGIDFAQNEGAQLLNDLISSANTYDLSYGPTVATAGKTIGVSFIENLDRNADPVRHRTGKPPEWLPIAGVADQIAFNWGNVTPQSKPILGNAERYTVVFHELAEAFAKIDKGQLYVEQKGRHGAHHDAVKREMILRNQRPELFDRHLGAGPGTSWLPNQVIRRVPKK